MQVELEGKFLNIDADILRKKLVGVGGKLVHAQQLMRRKNFDYPDGRLEKIGGWIRVRDEGNQVTLAYKQLVDRTLEGTKEISVIVSDFDGICNLLLSIGLDNKSYQETKRERWDLNGVEVTIDTWPWIPTFVELEAFSEDQLQAAAKKLELDWSNVLHGSVETAYQNYYSVTEEEIDAWEKITFVPVPDWLANKKKSVF